MLESAKNLLKKHFGYNEFRKAQEKVIESILKKEDTVAIMPTGAGKSICYQIPALIFEGVTVVISPLISLMKDQVDSLKEVGIEATYINSSLNNLEIEERIFNAREGLYKLIYIAPERLESDNFVRSLNNLNIALVAVDEAHCVSQWGHDFRPSYTKISNFIRKLSKRPIVTAFTATATETVRRDILKSLELQNPKVFVTGFDRENLSFSVIKGEDKEKFIFDYLENNIGKVGIIYTSTRKEAESLYNKINKKGYTVGVYHAGLSDEERKKTQEDFSFDNIEIIVATNAFGMGIDKSNVRFVIHHNIPKNMEAYYQEAGRAGRDGEESECILLFSPNDIRLQKYFIDESFLSPERKNNEYNKLRAMVDYCYTSKCLRSYILEYFGEDALEEKCNNCSTCNDNREEKDITLEAQKIFSCVYRMKERFGVNMVADVLRGSKNKKLLSLDLDGLSTYGIMEEFTQKDIVALMNKLIADDYMVTTDDKFPVVRLRSKSHDVLKGKEIVSIKVSKIEKKVKADNELFEILKQLRKAISQEESVPPFMIFPDATLKELSEYMPTKEEDLLKIKGIGERKAEVYGERFIEAITEYMNEKGIDINNMDNYESTKSNKESKIKTHVLSYNLYKEGKTIKEISEERNLKAITIQEHLFKCLSEGMEVDLDNFIKKDYEKLILDTIKKVGGTKLKPVKDELPLEVDYMCIKSVWYKYKDII
ncbi:DNA helicase RecQ [Clostridium botulinum]|uniref:DNA helicase RecQ n=1 Tax=Clostridium botulinum (strain Langeland / NCTC 10281 / Type F) TaxID=441772 RepID=A7GC33_CLOBL|nr:DNA helicase RecQ [Clostridium botulinum]ABS41954.1 ATP-dependent DNA helicase RecQ [Clostridium botulinum F str. Langeland]ADF98809.1 ATP-dependent DNA helicase RecQ [Clostridium botulinum F str. 230613]KKM39915.1 ATP-dependent DNA helicase [Clostridium botulinum]MBY6792073.1 DNA helicase RecQ [Clostridium botulinum]MBY6936082.1 DNA helicase RecQ [Clostridium botulinum]